MVRRDGALYVRVVRRAGQYPAFASDSGTPPFLLLLAWQETVNEIGNSRTERRSHTESATLANMETVVWADPSGTQRPRLL